MVAACIELFLHPLDLYYMKVLKKIFVFILLGFITLSSVGISFYLHECGCRQTTLISIEAGYSEADAFCCCAAEPESSKSSSCDSGLDEEGCCKDKYFFLLLPVGPDNAKVSTPDLKVKIIAQINFLPAPENEIPDFTSGEISIHSPPAIKSGKKLVFFLSQIKIPFPVA